MVDDSAHEDTNEMTTIISVSVMTAVAAVLSQALRMKLRLPA
jgi:hypothetical protein